jgi:RNase P protein component
MTARKATRNATFKNVNKGTQIAYIPSHAKGNINHKDVQFGFVTSKTVNGAFCRYWREDGKGLRTTANSELTPWDYLICYASHVARDVEELLSHIERNGDDN